MLDKAVRRYYELKRKQKEIEQELADLRSRILDHCAEQGVTETEAGRYKVRIVSQERREYDDEKLFRALPDAEVWRLVSKADPAKIAGLVKLSVIREDVLRDTYTLKRLSLLQVDKK